MEKLFGNSNANKGKQNINSEAQQGNKGKTKSSNKSQNNDDVNLDHKGADGSNFI